jgi:hypothetical protein
VEQIIDRVFSGGDKDYEKVKDREDFSIIRCAKYGPGGHKDILKYTSRAAPPGKDRYWVREGDHLLALNMIDSDDPSHFPPEMIRAGLDFAKEEYDKGRQVGFFCNQGESRGPSMALMFLRSIGELPHPFLQSVKVFNTLYPKYEPNAGIKQFCRSHWAEYNDIELRGNENASTTTP